MKSNRYKVNMELNGKPDSTKGNQQTAVEEKEEENSDVTDWKDRMTKVGKFMWKLLTSHLGLFIVMIAYSFVGAGIMYGIEGYYADQAKSMRNRTLEAIPDFKQHFVNITLEKEWNGTNAQTLYELLEQYEQKKADYDEDINGIKDHSYWEWLLFCLTVYTTIGYGIIAPASRPGRIATMVYATIGVPLFLMTMGKVGKLFTRGVKYLWSLVRRCYYLKYFRQIRKSKLMQKLKGSGEGNSSRISPNTTEGNGEVDTTDNASYISFNVDDEFNLHPLVAIIITLLYIVIGSFMYVQWEKTWAYHDAFYFIFISISTIGFGDLYPLHPKFFLLSSIYILFGLALVAMVINVLMDFFTETVHTVVEHIDHLPEILSGNDKEDEENRKGLKAGLSQLALNYQQTSEGRRTSVP